jgi:hypothetical protein
MDLLRYRRLQQDEKKEGERTLALRAAYSQLPRYGEPNYREAQEEWWGLSLVAFGLDHARYTRITELLYWLGERN